MEEIRPLDRHDLTEVADLFEFVVRSGATNASSELGAQLETLYFNHPWADSEIPSLVYVDGKGRIRGFIGSHVRRGCFDGNAVRIGCAGQLVTHPEARGKAPGLFLVRAYLDGRQDLSYTDTANHVTRRMWMRLGAVSADLLGIDWVRPFRPWRFAADRCFRGTRPLALLARPIAAGLDILTGRRVSGGVAEADPALAAERLTEAALVEAVRALPDSIRLRPAYDERFISWLFGELRAATSNGSSLNAVLLRDESGAIAGWHISRLHAGGTSSLLQVGSLSENASAIFKHALATAAGSGSVALQGRLEPCLVDPLAEERCLLRNRCGVLLHARSRDLIDAVLTGSAFVSRLEGDSWLDLDTRVFKEPR